MSDTSDQHRPVSMNDDALARALRDAVVEAAEHSGVSLPTEPGMDLNFDFESDLLDGAPEHQAPRFVPLDVADLERPDPMHAAEPMLEPDWEDRVLATDAAPAPQLDPELDLVPDLGLDPQSDANSAPETRQAPPAVLTSDLLQAPRTDMDIGPDLDPNPDAIADAGSSRKEQPRERPALGPQAMLAAGVSHAPMVAERRLAASAEDELSEPEPEPQPQPSWAPARVPANDAAAEQAVILHLRERGRLSDGDLARAGKLAEDSGEPLRLMLVRLGLVSDRDMAAAFGAVLGLPAVTAEDYPAEPVPDLDLSLRFLKYAHMVPLRDDGEALELAVADPVDSSAVEAVEMASGRSARLRVGLSNDIDAALERLYEKPEPEETDLDADLGNFSEEDIEHLRDLASEAPIIRLVNQILQRAVESRASDVHIEPFADELKVRYRIDGILKEGECPPVRSTAAVISRIKIMAKLNIAERRLPQDGRIPLRIQGKELDLRVSTVPTMFGESVVMRLLDKESVSFDFDALGFDGPPRERVLDILDKPYGIFLVTGPTGSGKSTTLYTALSRLNTGDRKIITVEDPVEYQVAGINQIPVKASIGMTFAHALRAIVRQDPDIIMVGEMRDLETARIAVQSALTGHVVLSTLHTNDAASGVTRLMDMGVEDYLLTSTINGILAQRLVRRLCEHCRRPFTPQPEMAARFLQLPGVDENNLTLYRPHGCDACNHSGYRGRLVIAEVLLMSDRLRQAVLKHATATEIQRIATDQDMLTMYQDGLRKAADGRTTVEEVLRVAAVSED